MLFKYPVPQVLRLNAAVGIGQVQEFLVLQAKEFDEFLVCRAKLFAVPQVPGCRASRRVFGLHCTSRLKEFPLSQHSEFPSRLNQRVSLYVKQRVCSIVKPNNLVLSHLCVEPLVCQAKDFTHVLSKSLLICLAKSLFMCRGT